MIALSRHSLEKHRYAPRPFFRPVASSTISSSAVKSGKAALVIVSEESSDNTKKKFQNMCDYYEVPVYFYGGKEELGHAMGKEFRASLAILDEGLAKSIEKNLKL